MMTKTPCPFRASQDTKLAAARRTNACQLFQGLAAIFVAAVVETAKAARKPGQIAVIPEGTAPLQGLSRVNDDLVQEMGRRAPNQRIGTVEQDATLQYSHKKQAQPTYDGDCGQGCPEIPWTEKRVTLASRLTKSEEILGHRGP
jgi:hypothetical protein